MSSVAELRSPVNDFGPHPVTDGSLALALPGLEAPKRARRHYPTASELGLALHGHKAGFFDRLPGSVSVSPRHAFHRQRVVDRAQSIGWDEIAPDPVGWITSLRVDVDRAGWENSLNTFCLPEPTFVVIDGATGRGHAIWTLAIWVKKSNVRAMRYLERVRRVYTAAVGGDPAYAGKFHHNPLAPRYRTTVGAKADWTLNDLANYVADVLYNDKNHEHRWATAKVREDVAALGRNCSTFEHVKVQAYAAVEHYRKVSTFQAFTEFVRARVEQHGATFANPIPGCDIRSITKSIATWTWYVYRAGKAAASAHRKRYEMRRDEYEARCEERRQRARALRAEGLTRTAIAATLGVSLSAVAVYLRGSDSSTKETVQSPPPIRIYAQGAEGGAAASPDPKNDLESEKIKISPVAGSNVIPFPRRLEREPERSVAELPSPPTTPSSSSGLALPNPLPGPRDVSHPLADRDECGPIKRSAKNETIFARLIRFVGFFFQNFGRNKKRMDAMTSAQPHDKDER